MLFYLVDELKATRMEEVRYACIVHSKLSFKRVYTELRLLYFVFL